MKFPSLTPDTAPPAARGMLVGSQQKFGFLPTPVAKAAGSPVALKHLLAGFAAFDESSLSHLEREVVAMTVAFEHGCHYCMALHSALLRDHAALVDALRAGTPLEDAKLEALRTFTREVIHTRGRPSTQAFEAAGYTPANALDVVLGVGVYTLSTYLNILTDAELDAPLAQFAWPSGNIGPTAR